MRCLVVSLILAAFRFPGMVLALTIPDDEAVSASSRADSMVHALRDVAAEDLLGILRHAIADLDTQIRRGAAQLLGEVGGDEAIALLIGALRDSEWVVREEAGRSLVKIGPPAVPALIALLSADHWKTPMLAAEALREIGAPAHPRLIELLRAGSWTAKTRAADILVSTGWHPTSLEDKARLLIARQCWHDCMKLGIDAASLLREDLEQAPPHVVIAAARTLGQHGDSLALVPLLSLFTHPDSLVRAAVVRVVGSFDNPRIVIPIRRLQRDPSNAVRDEVERVLLSRGWEHPDTGRLARFFLSEGKAEECARLGAGALPAILGALGEHGTRQRSTALYALSELRDPDCVGPLSRILADARDPRARISAARALGALCDPRTETPLIDALAAPDETVRLAAIAALKCFPSARAQQGIAARLTDSSERVRREAGQALHKTSWKPASVNEEVSYAISMSDWKRIEEIGQPAVGSLVALLADREYSGTGSAIRALGHIGYSVVVPVIIPYVLHRDVFTRASAAEALGSLGDTTAVPALVPLLGDPDRQVRQSAARALCDLRWEPGTIEDRVSLLGAMEDWRGLAALGDAGFGRLMHALRDGSYSWYKSDEVLAEAFHDVGTPAVDSLLVVLGQSGPYTQYRAALALARIADQRALRPFLALMDTRDTRLQETAIDGLGRIGDRVAVEPLVRLAHEGESSTTRARAMAALGAIGDPRAVPILAKAAADETSYEGARKTAISALARIGGDDAQAELAGLTASAAKPLAHFAVLQSATNGLIGPLESALIHKCASIRGTAAAKLDSLHWRPPNRRLAAYSFAAKADWTRCEALVSDASEVLLFSLNDEDASIVEGAIEPIGRLGLRAAIPRLSELLETLRTSTGKAGWYARRESIRRKVVRALGSIDDPATISPLISALSERDRTMRMEAVRALGRKGSASAVPLAQLQHDRDDSVARAARAALGALGDAATAPLIAVLQTAEEDSCINTVQALGLARGRKGVSVLLDLLNDRRVRVRAAAARALGHIGDLRALHALTQARRDAALEVRIAATRAVFDLRKGSEQCE